MPSDSSTTGIVPQVTLVSRIFTPEPGAAPVRLASLVRSLVAHGAKVDVLTTRAPAGFTVADSRDSESQVTVRRFPVLRDRAGYVRGYLQYLSFDAPLFLRLLFLRRPHVVIVEPPPTSGFVVRIVCALRRIPYVYYAADIWSDAVQSMSAVTLVHKVLRWVELFALRGAASVLSASEEFTERLVELGVSERVVTVRNGADLSYFTFDGERTTLDEPFFLYAGTASETQGASIFIDALELVLGTHPKATLVFVGQGADWEKLRKRAESFPEGTVRVLDRVAPDRVATWFRGATASLASLNPGQYDLSFPTRMYASVACGTRVIYAGLGPGSRFAAQPHVGWSVPFDAQEIAEAMRSALDFPISEEASSKLADWATENVSIKTVTDKGARVALAIAQGQRTEKSRGSEI